MEITDDDVVVDRVVAQIGHGPIAGSRIASIAYDQLIELNSINEGNCRKAGRAVLKGSAVVVAAGGKVAFIPVARAFGGSNLAWGWTLAACNAVSFLGLISWSFLKVIDKEMPTRSRQEVRMFKSRANCCGNIGKAARIGGSVVIGAVSQVPPWYIGLIYNPRNAVLPSLMAISDSGMPIYSLWSSLEAARVRRRRKAFEHKMNEAKQQLVGALLDNQSDLRKMPGQARIKWLRDIEEFRVRLLEGGSTTSESVASYMQKLLMPVDPQSWARRKKARSRKSCGRSLARVAVGVCSTVLSAAQLYLVGTISLNAMKEVTGKPGWQYSGAIGMTSCYAKLIVDGVLKTPLAIFDKAVGYFRGTNRRSLAFDRRPILYVGLRMLSAAFAGLSFGPTSEISNRYYTGRFRTAMQISCGTAVILMVGNAMGDLVEDIVEWSATRLKDEESTLLVRLHRKTKEFTRVVQESPMLELAKFLKLITANGVKGWMGRLEITQNNLKKYIDDNEVKDTLKTPLLLNEIV